MAFIGSREIGIKRTGNVVTIPSTNTAKCMYYISCITNILDLDPSHMSAINEYKDYQNHWRMTEADKRKIIELIEILSPARLKDKIIFEEPALCGEYSNEFLELSSRNLAVAAVENICIAGVSMRVRKIMVYKNSWINTYYYNALSGLRAELAPAVTYSSRRRSSSCVIL
jgi:hypothetical protein